MDSYNFFWGFVGGFLVEFYFYLSVIKKFKDKRLAHRIEASYAPSEDDEFKEPIPIEEWKEILEVFRPIILLFCLFSGVVGGVMAYLINPRDYYLAFFIGLTASATLSKFTPNIDNF